MTVLDGEQCLFNDECLQKPVNKQGRQRTRTNQDTAVCMLWLTPLWPIQQFLCNETQSSSSIWTETKKRAGEKRSSVLLRSTPFFFFLSFSNATTCSYELSWSPSWLWRNCNRLLRLGRPWGAVTLSRWCEGWYIGRWGARRGLKSKSTN